mgnify:CR=1 FL=1
MSTTRNLSRRSAGFTVLELAVGLVVATAGLIAVTDMIIRSQDAAAADYSKTKAIRKADDMLRLLSNELAQSTTAVDPSLPVAEAQRFWLQADGVRFQKVTGHDMTQVDDATTRWSPQITYRYDANRRAVLRQQGADAARTVAEGITDFQVRTTPTGQVVITVECEAGAANRGTGASTRRVVRITPRNRLQ